MADRGKQASDTKTQKSGYFNHQVSSKAQKHSRMAPWSDVLEYGAVVRCSGASLVDGCLERYNFGYLNSALPDSHALKLADNPASLTPPFVVSAISERV